MKKIQCDCGYEIEKDYFIADVIGEKYERLFRWLCPECGQGWTEEVKSNLKIKNDK